MTSPDHSKAKRDLDEAQKEDDIARENFTKSSEKIKVELQRFEAERIREIKNQVFLSSLSLLLFFFFKMRNLFLVF